MLRIAFLLTAYVSGAYAQPSSDELWSDAEDAVRRGDPEQTAIALLAAVNEDPRDRRAAWALAQAAHALDRAGRVESAMRVRQRIIDTVGPLVPADAAHAAELDGILASAYFRLAFVLRQRWELEPALQNYRVLCDSARFVRSSSPDVVVRVQDALLASAELFALEGSHESAARYYRRLATTSDDAAIARMASFRVGEMFERAGAPRQTIRAATGFISRYRNDRHAATLVFEAHGQIVRARDTTTTRGDLVRAFGRLGLAPGTTAAAKAAEVHLALLDVDARLAEIEAGRGSTTRRVADAKRVADELATSLAPVLAYRSPLATIRALQLRGRVHQRLAARLRSLHVDEEADVAECRAVVDFVITWRATRRVGDLSVGEHALAAISGMSEQRINACILGYDDPTLHGFSAGELERHPIGLSLTVPAHRTPELED